MTHLTTSKILETAIEIEEQSFALYMAARKKVQRSSSRRFLEELAKEEERHKTKLLAMKKDARKLAELGRHEAAVQDLKIVDFMEDTPLSADADYATILVYAAKREKNTFDYYSYLARGFEGTDSGKLFTKLAQEELAHKTKLETEYDEQFLKED